MPDQARLQYLTIPGHLDFTASLAQSILKHQQGHLPDLSHVQVILPNAQAIAQLHRQLGLQTDTALISGFSGSLDDWLKQTIRLESPCTLLNPSARQLLFIEALKEFPSLFDEENHWQVCDSLLTLFDELSLSPHQWLDESLPVWIEQLRQAYQAKHELPPLNQEARIIQTLWHAWQQQLADMQLCDASLLKRQLLLTPIPHSVQHQVFYITGFEQMSPLEQAWCERLAQKAPLYCVQQGQLPDTTQPIEYTPTEQEALLQDIYNHSTSFYNRCQAQQQMPQDFPLNHIQLYDAQSAEQETRAVDIHIRQALLAGRKNIAVVTENRKLARRLRALLERADVDIQDTAGWALATTSAASFLERWLECIEQDFSHLPLLDLLKSPFFTAADERNEHLQIVYRFEQDIILHENIANDLKRYRKAIAYRKARLSRHSETTSHRLNTLLEQLEQASATLVSLYSSDQHCSAEHWLNSLFESLYALEVPHLLEADKAGKRMLEELGQLRQASNMASPEMSWQDFRTWLGSCLERAQFKPHGQPAAVKIMNLQQAQYCQFDSLIIAGANAQSFPGKAAQLPFFNQSVRQSLGLDFWQQQQAYQLYQFQQLCLAADEILITWQTENRGEWLAPSPWVESLNYFAQNAFDHSMRESTLAELVEALPSLSQVSDDHIAVTEQARPRLKPELLPGEFSASRHQRLIDCPYKFFAADALRLKPLESISTELLKSEYGEKVHQILHAFHQQQPGHPPAFTQAINPQNRQQALCCLQEISRYVFQQNSEDSLQLRGWLERWMQTAESYIDWQMQRNQNWQVSQLELDASTQLSPELQLQGRLDRIDQQGEQRAIIDYKTGTTARQNDIEIAENVQLISYAALMQDVAEVLYLKMDKGETRVQAHLEEPELEELVSDTSSRLQTLVSQIQQQTPMPSWGDEACCQHCDMQGLCRQQIWRTAL